MLRGAYDECCCCCCCCWWWWWCVTFTKAKKHHNSSKKVFLLFYRNVKFPKRRNTKLWQPFWRTTVPPNIYRQMLSILLTLMMIFAVQTLFQFCFILSWYDSQLLVIILSLLTYSQERKKRMQLTWILVFNLRALNIELVRSHTEIDESVPSLATRSKLLWQLCCPIN